MPPAPGLVTTQRGRPLVARIVNPLLTLHSWKNLRGSQPIQLNAGLSLMQSYGSDVGGFAGVYPTPELFVRWVQLGVTHSRFCIHSSDKTPSGEAKLNTPWMVSPSVV